MTQFNISQAALVTGTSRATIQRKLKSGELSSKLDGQKKLIDMTDLIKVFGELKVHLNAEVTHVETPATEQMLRERVDDLQEQVRFLQKQVENAGDNEKKMLSLLVEEQKSSRVLRLEHQKNKRGFFARIFGKKETEENA